MSALPRSPRFRGVAACLLLLAVAGCESGAARLQKLVGDTRPSGVKVLVVGIDGAGRRWCGGSWAVRVQVRSR